MFDWFYRSSSTINSKQRVLGAAENALMMASQQYQGYMKVGEVLHLQGPQIIRQILERAIHCLQRRHPILRSRLQHNPNQSNGFLLEEDDTLCLEILEISRKRNDHLTFWRYEWRKRERETTPIGQGLVKFWLLQDPDDHDDNNAPREVVIIGEHSICDGLSLSTIAHELLIALSNDNENILGDSLAWPSTMEDAIRKSLSTFGRFIALGRFIISALYLHSSTNLSTARVSFGKNDFTVNDMMTKCHTETSYGSLSKQETWQLRERCHQENVTVTSAVATAILCAISLLVNVDSSEETVLKLSIGADTRRRCVPPVPNHDLSYHVSGIMPYVILRRDIPRTTEDMWQLARQFGDHTIRAINAGQILACGLAMGKIFEKTIGSTNVNNLPTCGVSSWGLLPFHEQYGFWKLVNMTPFVNMICGPLPFAILQTVNEILTIMFVGPDPVIPFDTIERLQNATMEKLRHMIQD